MKLAAERRKPIPVYAEMSSVNPVVLLPAALKARAEALATGFAASLTLGVGQFCTNPGLVFAIEGPDLDRFVATAAEAVVVMVTVAAAAVEDIKEKRGNRPFFLYRTTRYTGYLKCAGS